MSKLNFVKNIRFNEDHLKIYYNVVRAFYIYLFFFCNIQTIYSKINNS